MGYCTGAQKSERNFTTLIGRRQTCIRTHGRTKAKNRNFLIPALGNDSLIVARRVPYDVICRRLKADQRAFRGGGIDVRAERASQIGISGKIKAWKLWRRWWKRADLRELSWRRWRN